MNGFARQWVMVGAVLVLHGCHGDKPAEPVVGVEPTLRTSQLPCYLGKREGIADEDTTGVPIIIRGPLACGRTLELFLREHATAHIVSIIPIEYPAPPVETPGEASHSEGTQELLIVHADRGHWPVAGSLKVGALVCGTDKTAFGPTQCRSTIENALMHAKQVEFWVPLTTQPVTDKIAPGTTNLLMVERRPKVP